MVKYQRAICYSGYREGQIPGQSTPTPEQVKEDLLILQGRWKYLRLYDCDPLAESVLDTIANEKMDFQVMLGAYISAEMNNFGCPWGGVYPEDVLEKNKMDNKEKIEKLIALARKYSDIVFAVSAGNEACASWTDHYVQPEKVLEYVKTLKAGTDKPVTYCENYIPWITTLGDIAAEVDFISMHTYPVWEYKDIHHAMAYTKQNYQLVADKYPGKEVIITEAGWATESNGRGIHQDNVSEEIQKTYLNELLEWGTKENIITFVFEAFDEYWKGSADPAEPEKHWGIYHTDRTPKLYAK